MDTESNAEQGPAQPQAQVEDAEAFEHIKQGSEPYDAQTYGTELRDPLPCSCGRWANTQNQTTGCSV